jgi:2-polyprenyl-3-methyl-5-hydroxy-6-metoxy-1,4-benzoquinol methylase
MITPRQRLVGLTARVSAEYRMLAGGLLANQLADDDPLWPWAERAMAHVERLTGGDEDRIAQCLDSFVVTSLDFLRLQARFMKTGAYACGSASETRGLYDDPERMTDYLDGLALTYAMWVNHTRMLEFFVSSFVPRIPAGGHLVEIGPGHGLLAAEALREREDLDYVGLDISPRSVSYSIEAFTAASIDPARYRLQIGDASQLVPGDLGVDRVDAVVCCEVLEHVDDPAAVLGGIRSLVDVGCRVFVSTVANMEAEDHVFLFHDADHIESVVRDAGFSIDAEQPLVLAGAEHLRPQPLNYSAVIIAR